MDTNKSKSKQAIVRSGGIVFLTLGIAFVGGSYVLDIDGLRAAGIGLAVIGLVMLFIRSLKVHKN
jgi:small neutral amino acid transporter SnatA (MarC family)